MSDLPIPLAGKFIVLDGPDGSGKTTQLGMLRDHLVARGIEVECVRDPGGTAVGDKIREILLDRENGRIAPTCETMLFMASRAQLVAERIKPAIAAGKAVLCDRFISATVAYQGALGVDRKTIIEVGNVAVQGVWPDLTIILDVPPERGLRRIGVPREKLKKPSDAGGAQLSLLGDRLEVKGSEFHRTVRRRFLDLCKPGAYPGPVAKVDARPDTETVFNQVVAELRKALG